MLKFIFLIFFSFSACRQVTTEVPEPEVEEIVVEKLQMDKSPPHEWSKDDLVFYYLRADSQNEERIVIDFGLDIFQKRFNGEKEVVFDLKKDISFTLNPPVEFTVSKYNSSSLIIKPKKGFSPETNYQVRIDKFKWDDQDIDLEKSPAIWSHAFYSPPLTLVGTSAMPSDLKKNRFKLALAYSSQVSPPTVSAAFGSTVIEDLIVLSGSKKNIVTVTGQVSGGVPSAVNLDISDAKSLANQNLRAAATSKRVSLLRNKGLTIYGPYLKETSAGFVLEFVCDDHAVKGYRPWHWDSSIRFDKRISKRCHVTEDEIASHVSIQPSVSTDLYHTQHGFALRAPLTRGKYQVQIKSGLQTVDGGMLSSDIYREFVSPNRGSLLRFLSKGRYLPKQAWGKMAIRHRNVSNATLQIRHIPRNNLHSWLHQNGDAVKMYGDVVMTQSLSLDTEKNQTGTTTLDFADREEVARNGVYEVQVKGNGKTDFLRVQVTDLNLVAKKELPAKTDEGSVTSGRLHVWALDMNDNQPAANATIQLYRPSGSLAESCESDGDGYCLFETLKDEYGQRKDYLITATLDDRFTYLQPDELIAPMGEYDVSGDTRSDKPYRISIQSDRGAYRPGDTAHFNAILRNVDGSAAASGIKVALRLKDARGRTVKERKLKTNSAGVLSESIPLSHAAGTGRWSLHLDLGTKQKEVYRFLVEDLAPERMSISLKPDSTDVLLGTPVSLQIDARYLFGSKASNAPFEVKCRVSYAPFSPKSAKGYVFGSNTPFDSFDLGTVRGRLDEEGRAGAACPDMVGSKVALGPAKVEMAVSVFEAGSGRSTLKKSSVRVHEAQHYIGFKSGLSKIEAGNTYSFSGLVVDWKGRTVNWNEDLKLDFSLLQTGHNWIYNEQSGKHTARRYQKELSISSNKLTTTNGRFHFSLSAEQEAGRFRLKATSDGLSATYDIPGKSRYYWDSDKEVDQTPSPMKPDKLHIEGPDQIEPGTAPELSVIAPYAGRLLWTVETDRVLVSKWVDVPFAGKLKWSPDMSVVENKPNAYISALLIKDPHLESESAFFPNRGLGVKSIRIKPVDNLHELTLSTPKEIASQSTLKIDVDLGGPVEDGTVVMVSAVDEGLLSLTNFKRPNPLPKLFPRDPLGVSSHETVGWAAMIPAAGAASAVGGGGMDKDANQRPDVMKPVSLYSNVVAVPSSGKTSIEFTLPQYSGRLRVVALSASPSKIGVASTDVVVADPVVVTATTPRFLTEDDLFIVPVFLSNRSGEKKDISISLGAADSSAIKIMGENPVTVSIENGKSETVPLKAKALWSSGFTTLKIAATIDGDTKIQTHDVPFQSASPRSTETFVQRLEPGQAFDFSVASGYRSGEAHMLVSKTPYAKALGHAKHLIRYPHGCAEQTTSALRPLLTASDALPAIGLKDVDVDKMILSGIERLSALQTSSGGFGYWPGASSPNKWTTAYATHVLMDARSAGHPVFKGMIESALTYMKSEIQYRRRKMDHAEPYMHFVLAKAGQGDRSRIKSLISMRRQSISPTTWEDLYLLKAALYLSGDRRYESDLKNPRYTILAGLRNSKRFWSPLRANALALAIHQDLFGLAFSESHALELAALMERDSVHYSTQELAWAFYALSSRIQGTSESWQAPALKYGSTPLKVDAESDLLGRSWNLYNVAETSKAVLLANDTTYATLRVVGDKPNAAMLYGSNGVDVQREYLDVKGNLLNPEAINLGDVSYVRLTVRNMSIRRINELALTDRIPAGWEIENANLGRSSDVRKLFTTKTWKPEYQSIRDNRFVVYGDLKPYESRQVIYTVRAVNSGVFSSPSVELEAMYEPEIWSKKSGPIIKIQGPWTGSQL